MEKILEVKNLKTAFTTESGSVNAVDDVSFTVYKGRTLGIVGESGCGKSVTSLSIMRLIPDPPGRIVGGEILYKGQDLLKLSAGEMRRLRGNEISMIFQEPMTSLNPVFTIGDQIEETVRLHQKLGRSAARAKAIEMLKLVNMPSPETRVDEYPHQLSGGMRQRVMIAMALACKPQVLICDEPTTALDVTIQAQILEIMSKLRETMGMAMILITHDLGVVAETADDVAVMYAGRIVEQGPVGEIFANPKHPYTRGLLGSIPKLAAVRGAGRGSGAPAAAATVREVGVPRRKARLETITGIVPSLAELPRGCRFQGRCPYVFDLCRDEAPALRDLGVEHKVACYKEDIP